MYSSDIPDNHDVPDFHHFIGSLNKDPQVYTI